MINAATKLPTAIEKPTAGRLPMDETGAGRLARTLLSDPADRDLGVDRQADVRPVRSSQQGFRRSKQKENPK